MTSLYHLLSFFAPLQCVADVLHILFANYDQVSICSFDFSCLYNVDHSRDCLDPVGDIIHGFLPSFANNDNVLVGEQMILVTDGPSECIRIGVKEHLESNKFLGGVCSFFEDRNQLRDCMSWNFNSVCLSTSLASVVVDSMRLQTIWNFAIFLRVVALMRREQELVVTFLLE